jgi:hypothetical protein
MINVLGSTGACMRCDLTLLIVLTASIFFARYLNPRNWEARSSNACDDIPFVVVHHHGTRGVRKYATALFK